MKSNPTSISPEGVACVPAGFVPVSILENLMGALEREIHVTSAVDPEWDAARRALAIARGERVRQTCAGCGTRVEVEQVSCDLCGMLFEDAKSSPSPAESVPLDGQLRVEPLECPTWAAKAHVFRGNDPLPIAMFRTLEDAHLCAAHLAKIQALSEALEKTTAYMARVNPQRENAKEVIQARAALSLPSA